METRIYNTKANRELLCGDYMCGMINGLARGLTQPIDALINEGPNPVVNSRDKYGNFIVTMRCTAEQYATFAKVIEATYPDLCEFDCEIEK